MASVPVDPQTLEKFAEAGEKHAFRFRDGEEFLGWVLEVRGHEALLAFAPSPFYAQGAGTDEMAPPDRWVPLSEIVLESLCYWDGERRSWYSYPSGVPSPRAAQPGSAPWWKALWRRMTSA